MTPPPPTRAKVKVKRFKATGATADKTTPCRRKSACEEGGRSCEEEDP